MELPANSAMRSAMRSAEGTTSAGFPDGVVLLRVCGNCSRGCQGNGVKGSCVEGNHRQQYYYHDNRAQGMVLIMDTIGSIENATLSGIVR